MQSNFKKYLGIFYVLVAEYYLGVYFNLFEY